MKRIIFLDIDGVLRTFTKDMDDSIDPILLKNLEKLIQISGCKIIISSTWRYGGIGEDSVIFKRLISAGSILTHKSIIGYTPLNKKTREEQILESALLDMNWIAIDDMDLDLGERFFRTDSYIGLSEDIVNDIIKFWKL